MYLIADAAGLTGEPHAQAAEPAQDYYLAQAMPHGAFAVVADGCSHGGAEAAAKQQRVFRTDVGARLLALSTAKVAAQQLQAFAAGGVAQAPFIRNAIRSAHQETLRHAISHLELDAADLMASWLLVMATSLPNGTVQWLMLGEGDGAVVINHPTDGKTLHEWTWRKGGAFYPAYRLNPELLDSFGLWYGGFDSISPDLKRNTWHFKPEVGEWRWDIESTLPLSRAMDEGLMLSGTLPQGGDIAVVTDGLGAWCTGGEGSGQPETALPVTEAANELTRLVRKDNVRVRAALTIANRKLRARKFRPMDDFSIAAVSVMPDVEEPA